MTNPTPAQIGRYRIEREVGRGGMGVVYEAVDTLLGRTVALKTFAVNPSTPEREREAFERRFLEEARIAATLEHPNVVAVHDLGRDAETGLLFMALEYVRGETLAEALGRGPMPWPQGCRLIAKVARALHTAHEKKIVHRDVKPANIMVTPSGEPKLMDFGIAKGNASHLTLVGQIFGTPAYMSPEQGAGDAVDARSDIFSLGSVLYELVTNAQAFLGETSSETLRKVLHEEPRPASARTGVPKALDAILSRALRKSRDERYQSAVEFADELDDLVDGVSETPPPLPSAEETQQIVQAPRTARPPAPAATVATPAPPATAEPFDQTVTLTPGAVGATGSRHTGWQKVLAFASMGLLILAAGGWLLFSERAEHALQRDARARMAELEAASSATALSRDQEVEAWTRLARQAASEQDAATASAALQHVTEAYPGDQRVIQLAEDLNAAFAARAMAAEEEMLAAQMLAEKEATSTGESILAEADGFAAAASQSMTKGEFAAATRAFVAATAAYDRARRPVTAGAGKAGPGGEPQGAWVFVTSPTESGSAGEGGFAGDLEFTVSPSPLSSGAPFRVQILLRNRGISEFAFGSLVVRVIRNGEVSTPEIRLLQKSVAKDEHRVVAEIPAAESGQLLVSEGITSWRMEVEAVSARNEHLRGALTMKRAPAR